jgi:RimJ/RimL family protein N-acetyltransferase
LVGREAGQREVEIRAAAPHDLEGIVSLAMACGRARQGWARTSWFPPSLVAERKLWWERLHDIRTWCAVAVSGPSVVGVVCAWPARRLPVTGGHGAYVGGPLVDPEWWGSGVGSVLHAEVMATLEQLGYSRAEAATEAGDRRARRFLERHGWEPVEEGRPRSPMVVTTYARRLRASPRDRAA